MTDLGFVELSAAEIAGLGKQNFVSIDDPAPVPTARWSNRCMLVGYPEKAQRRVDEAGEYRMEQTLYTAPELRAGGYVRAQLNRATHVGIEFDRRRIAGARGKGGEPQFNGMSGCAVWLLNPYTSPTSSADVALLGFLLGKPPKHGKALFGPRVVTLHAVIAEADKHEAQTSGAG